MSNKNAGNLHELLPRIVDEYQDWFGRVMRRLFYPDADEESIAPPQTFAAWKKDTSDIDEHLSRIHEELHKAAKALIQGVGTGKPRPPYKVFDGFINLYEEFIVQLRRFERDKLHANLGIDTLTGLRTHNAMEQDVERELERRARRGKPFSLVFARIDDFEKLAGVDVDQKNHMILYVAGLIKKSIRTYDDAYRIGEGEFIMSLKHTELSGAVATINRMRQYLQEEPMQGEGLPKITLSYCAAEPMPGDNVSELIFNMRADLKHYDDGGNMAMEYIEQSPLERFIKSANTSETVS
jgi:diguanylate cyclase